MATLPKTLPPITQSSSPCITPPLSDQNAEGKTDRVMRARVQNIAVQLTHCSLHGRNLIPNPEQHLTLAKQKLKVKDLDGYEASLSLAAAGARSNELKITCLCDLVKSQYSRQKYRDALHTCEELIQLRPETISLRFSKATCLFSLRQFDQLIQEYFEILKKDPQELLRRKAACSEAINNLTQAYDNGQSNEIDQKYLLHFLELIYQFQVIIGDFRRALVTCDEMRVFKSQADVKWLLSTALCHLKLGHYDQAVDLYLEARDLGSDCLLEQEESVTITILYLHNAVRDVKKTETKLDLLNVIYEFHLKLGQHLDAYYICLEIEEIEPGSTVLEQIQSLFYAGKLSWEETINEFKISFQERDTLQVDIPIIHALARIFRGKNLPELAIDYQKWAEELLP